MRIDIAHTDQEVARCHAVMGQLRPQLAAEGFVERVRVLEGGGYRLAFLEEEGQVKGVAGFRLLEMLSRGRFMYVDDLVTDANARSRGHGAALLEWLARLAVEEGCEQIDLDSGVQRAGAHRFYFREGMHIASYHFTRDLPGRGAV